MLEQIFTWQFLIVIIASAIGSVGFSLLFRLNNRHLVSTAIGGSLTYAVYFIVDVVSGNLFLAAFFSSLTSALFSEIMARVKRAPAVVFLLPCAIPIVPGGSLYYCMSSLIAQNNAAAMAHLTNAILVGIGIAAGTVAVSVLFVVYRVLRTRIAEKNNGRLNEENKDN